MIGQPYLCAAQEPSRLPPLLSSGRRDPLSFREESYSHCTRSPSNAHKKIKSPSITQMPSGYQQVTGNINSFNNIVNFITNLNDEGRQVLQWLRYLNYSNGTKISVPNHPVRTPEPGRPIVPSIPGRVGKDARAKRPSLRKTAVLVVDCRALQSLVRRVLPVVLCRARPSPLGPCGARPSSIGLGRHPWGPAGPGSPL